MYLIFHFKNKLLLVHLGMSGKFLIVRNKDNMMFKTSFYYDLNILPKHNHIYFFLSNGLVLIYNDIRRFGFFKLFKTSQLNKIIFLKKLGLEVTARNIAKTWFILGEKARYFDLCIQAGKETSVEAADNALIAMKKYNGTNNLKLIKNETLIIWGDGDKSYNYKLIQTLKGYISNSSLVIFKKCAHNIHLEKIEEFNRTIQNFLKK